LTEGPSADDARASSPIGDDALAAGLAAVAHLQSAALEVIAALRATLDLAEDLVRDPALPKASGSLTAVITRVFEAVEPIIAAGRPGPAGSPGHQNRQAGRAAPDPPDDGPVEHIRVS
jgi:hypothetical protein